MAHRLMGQWVSYRTVLSGSLSWGSCFALWLKPIALVSYKLLFNSLLQFFINSFKNQFSNPCCYWWVVDRPSGNYYFKFVLVEILCFLGYHKRIWRHIILGGFIKLANSLNLSGLMFALPLYVTQILVILLPRWSCFGLSFSWNRLSDLTFYVAWAERWAN